jgi:CubicO group peptidase (beta-lactamase class C family)
MSASASPPASVEGRCDERFAAVAREFERNFAERGEVGASLCVIAGGETVIDLWGGVANPQSGAAWQRDTLSIVFSCTKGAVALCAHVLASRGQLDLDAPIRELWPEFARDDKANATVRMALDHTLGVPVFKTPLEPGGCTRWEYMIERLEAEPAFWKPGTRHAYHMLNFGWTVGELVRRASGRPLGDFFRETIAEPLGLDFWIGLPEAHEARLAPISYQPPSPGAELGEFMRRMFSEPQSIQALALFNTGGFDPNTRASRAAQIGGAGGITNARGLAGMYAPLASGGERGGVRLVDGDTLARMGQVSSATHEDATLLVPTRFALGFMKSIDNRRRAFGDRDSAILGAPAFGHCGLGGSIGFADPEAGLAFGYTMNHAGLGVLLNERGQSLVDAVYRCLGYRSNESGCWLR